MIDQGGMRRNLATVMGKEKIILKLGYSETKGRKLQKVIVWRWDVRCETLLGGADTFCWPLLHMVGGNLPFHN